jgi:hypothetical protein
MSSRSNMGDVGEYEVLFSDGFVKQVLNCSVHVALVAGSRDFLGKLGKQRKRNIMS